MTTALSSVSAASPGALQAELQKAQHELSNCVNCDSAKTSSGQAKIATLQAQVQGIEQRIEKAKQADPPAQAAAAAATVAPPLSSLGNFLDIYA